MQRNLKKGLLALSLMFAALAHAGFEMHVPVQGMRSLISPCATPWGASISSGSQTTAYSSSSVAYGATCAAVSTTLSCSNGVLSGDPTNTYVYGACSVAQPQICQLPWGGTLSDGQSVVAYTTATVTSPDTCSAHAVTVSCSGGSLTGTATSGTCTPLGEVIYTQAAYSTASIRSDTYTWTAPAGVTSVSVVAVGPGAYGGGGLGWKNNIAVTPGQSYTVVVGRAFGGGPTLLNGTDSYFISPATVRGGAGNSRTGGGFTGDGGGNGGTAGVNAGGGAGGYAGDGGAGAPTSTGVGSAGAGGGGGGAAANGGFSGGGGGVGLSGQGTSGAGGTNTATQSDRAGRGGSGGNDGAAANTGSSTNQAGGDFGGGAATWSSSSGIAGRGAVRIIWPGTTRQFPATNTR